MLGRGSEPGKIKPSRFIDEIYDPLSPAWHKPFSDEWERARPHFVDFDDMLPGEVIVDSGCTAVVASQSAVDRFIKEAERLHGFVHELKPSNRCFRYANAAFENSSGTFHTKFQMLGHVCNDKRERRGLRNSPWRQMPLPTGANSSKT